MASTIPVREAKRILQKNGFAVIKQGSHEVWGDSTGQRVSLPHKPVGGVLYGFLAQSIRRIERGIRPAKDRVSRAGPARNE